LIQEKTVACKETSNDPKSFRSFCVTTWLAANAGFASVGGGLAEPFAVPRSRTDSGAPKQSLGKRFYLPVKDDSALQAEAVLIVVITANGQGTVVAEARVEIFRLDET
jgi:hypothetical protein